MKCEEIRDELIAYLKGELSAEFGKEVDEHLARCHGCQRELETARRVLADTQAADEVWVIKMANEIIMKGIESGASDIHFDPTADGMDIRYRIDGVLRPDRTLSKKEQDAVTARVRMMAEVSLTENRIAQDGRLPVRRDGKEYDLRVSIVPSIYGLKMVLRIFDRGTPLLGLDKMCFSDEQLETVRELVRRPNGIIVCTGPAGSGKTTLMYSMILELPRSDISIVSVEDPVEYQLRGIQQTQVNPRAGLTFASAVRAYLRQDPDVLMIGEVRDYESMVLASEAAHTGHLVLTQTSVGNATSIPQHMAAFGVDPWIIGQNLIGVVAARLARMVCPDCREEYTPSEEALRFLGLHGLEGNAKFQRGKGCETCKGSGFRGRSQLHEVLIIDRDLSRMIASGQVDPDVLLAQAVADGFKTMVDDARQRVLEGITTAEEAHRILEWR